MQSEALHAADTEAGRCHQRSHLQASTCTGMLGWSGAVIKRRSLLLCGFDCVVVTHAHSGRLLQLFQPAVQGNKDTFERFHRPLSVGVECFLLILEGNVMNTNGTVSVWTGGRIVVTEEHHRACERRSLKTYALVRSCWGCLWREQKQFVSLRLRQKLIPSPRCPTDPSPELFSWSSFWFRF